MLFYSTNRHLPHGFQEKVSFKSALLTGQAPDEGLFMPEFIPQLTPGEILSLKNKSYPEVAKALLKTFFEDEISDEKLIEICQEAYPFEVPVEKIPENKNEATLFIARMDTGPTASFKDYAAQLMARLMAMLKPDNQLLTVLVATSGDTGSAIGEAFKNVEGIRVCILYPKNEVSNIQRKQLTTLGGNVTALEIDGKFDDCQRFVKMAFTDPELKQLHLTSANSINIGRLLPQLVYYFYIYLKVAQDLEEVDFCIPTGNLGNAMGCEIARQMGLPVHKIILATNANHTLPDWLKNGVYQKVEPSANCISNAMNVGNPSNTARLFDLYGGAIDKNGTVHRSPDLTKIRQHFTGYEISDSETVTCVRDFYEKKRVLLEPHGAVGMVAIQKYLAELPAGQQLKTILMETAHPAKFPEVIEKELGFSPELPENLKLILQKEEKKIVLPPDYESFKQFLLEN